MWIGDDVDVELSLAIPAALDRLDAGVGRTINVCAEASGAARSGGRTIRPVTFEEDLCARRE